jgi:hypothetical protein
MNLASKLEIPKDIQVYWILMEAYLNAGISGIRLIKITRLKRNKMIDCECKVSERELVFVKIDKIRTYIFTYL